MSNSTRQDRVAEFLQRLASAPAARSGDEALRLISKTLDEVEDQLTDIPNQPQNWQTDGRMYPPQADNARELLGRTDVVRYRSRGHHTFIRDNGAIEIRNFSGTVIFSKHGTDGSGVDLKEQPEE